MPKVVYILPLYDEKTPTHFFYNYELLRRASLRLDIFVVIEKALASPNLNAPFKIQTREKGLSRFLELYGILKKLKKEGYNNFYVHYSFYGALAAWLAGGKVFYFNRGMPWLFKRGFLRERVFRFILRHSILVTSPESLAKEYVRRYGVKEYRVLSNWVDTERLKPRESKEATKGWFGIRGGSKVVLFVHHLSERKGADLIFPIAAEFEDMNVLFFVVGDGPYLEKLKEEAGTSKAPIMILGAIPARDLATYFQAADVFFMPSREEGSPHVLLEALAAGTPFVAADVGGVKEVVPPGFEEFLCKEEELSCFPNQIKKLLLNKEIYENFRTKGLEFVKNFDKERGMREFVELFS